MGKYEVKILKAEGTCKDELFKTMAENGDITAIKISEMLNEEVKITGFACCEIITDDKDFNINYYATEEGYILSSGSSIFMESVLAYLGKVDTVRIQKIKTSKGSTYKAVPVLKKKEATDNVEKKDLPF